MTDERTDLDGGLSVHVAVVYTADGVRFVAASPSAGELTAHVAAYVRREAPRQLAEHDARRIRDLLDDGRAEAAIDLYFNAQNVRWDVESLSTHVGPLATTERAPVADGQRAVSLPAPSPWAILTAQSMPA